MDNVEKKEFLRNKLRREWVHIEKTDFWQQILLHLHTRRSQIQQHIDNLLVKDMEQISRMGRLQGAASFAEELMRFVLNLLEEGPKYNLNKLMKELGHE